MHVCMVTPHLPPDQAANALLPPLLARELREAGVRSHIVGHAREAPEPAVDYATTHLPRRG